MHFPSAAQNESQAMQTSGKSKVSSVGRAVRLHRIGRGFKSLTLYHLVSKKAQQIMLSFFVSGLNLRLTNEE